MRFVAISWRSILSDSPRFKRILEKILGGWEINSRVMYDNGEDNRSDDAGKKGWMEGWLTSGFSTRNGGFDRVEIDRANTSGTRRGGFFAVRC